MVVELATLAQVAPENVVYEEDILKNAYSTKAWWRYLDHNAKTSKSRHERNILFERALRQLPGSFKMWYLYLTERRHHIRRLSPCSQAYQDLNETYERALVFMHKMPRIWLDYLELLCYQRLVTKTRLTFDRCLRALPLTQHNLVWPMFLDFVRSHDVGVMAVRVFRRFMKLDRTNVEEYIDYLMKIDKLDEAAIHLADIVNNDNYVSPRGKSNHGLWVELATLISENPDKVTSLDTEAILRSGIERFTDMVGRLWVSLADFHIRQGHFEAARDIYEEGMGTVVTARDFSQIFDAYSQFEESMIAAKMEEDGGDGSDMHLDLRLARFEELMNNRPLLLNLVLLHQNPHNVAEWIKRTQLLEGRRREIIETFTQATTTVDATKAVGNPAELWEHFAQYFEREGELDLARSVFEKAVVYKFKNVDNLARVWLTYTEMEMKHGDDEAALVLIRRASYIPPQAGKYAYRDAGKPAQDRVHKSLKIWSMYVDLEEALGTFESTKAVYNSFLELRIATPQIVINFGAFLDEHNYFEESFKAYEKAVSTFRWPVVYDVWNTYLTKFTKRYGGDKLERARDLFEQCLKGIPKKYARPIYLLYSKLEEEYGLARRAMSIYDRACREVAPEEQMAMFQLYIKRAADLYGVTHTREIYERAIEVLPNSTAQTMCQKFAALETKLGEIDRARAIFAHGSQMGNPTTVRGYWSAWQDFEKEFGNEDTFRELLRIKRSVQAQYNTSVNYAAARLLKSKDEDAKLAAANTAAAAAAAAATGSGDGAQQPRQPGRVMQFTTGGDQVNPDEIDLDDDDDDEDEEGSAPMEQDVTELPVPNAVFGGLAAQKAG